MMSPFKYKRPLFTLIGFFQVIVVIMGLAAFALAIQRGVMKSLVPPAVNTVWQASGPAQILPDGEQITYYYAPNSLQYIAKSNLVSGLVKQERIHVDGTTSVTMEIIFAIMINCKTNTYSIGQFLNVSLAELATMPASKIKTQWTQIQIIAPNSIEDMLEQQVCKHTPEK